MDKIKIVRSLFLRFVLCLCMLLFLIPAKINSVFGALPSIVVDSTQDTSITNSETAVKYSLVMSGKKQDFLIIAVYGPSPCSPISEGGSAFYALSISPTGTQYSQYIYVPKIISYKIQFIDYNNNILKTITGKKNVEYHKTGALNNKRIVGWIYGFFKPNEFKNTLGERYLRMSYQIWFENGSLNQLEFDTFANNLTLLANKYANKNFAGISKEKHRLISSRAGEINYVSGELLGIATVVPSLKSMATAGMGITGRAGGGPLIGYGIDMVSGAFVDDAVDMTLPGGVSIARHYNSAMGYQPGRCFGWMFNFEEFLRFDPDRSIFYRQHDFKEYRFTQDISVPSNQASNTMAAYIPTKGGNFLKLKQNLQGDFEITFKNRSKKVFDSYGRLTQIIDKSGNTITYTWGNPADNQNAYKDIPEKILKVMGPADIMRANQALIITNPYGRSIQVKFNALGRVDTISDWSGRYVQYFWDNIQGIYLLKFRNSGNNYIEYTYNGNAYNQITGVRHPNGIKINNYYLNASPPNSQIVSYQDNPAGGKIAYNYGWLSNPQQRWTTVNKDGKITTYYYDENGSIIKIEKPGANNTKTVFTFSYYDDKNLLKSITNPLGQTISYSYDERGNRIATTFPDGRNIKMTYDKNTDRLTDYWDTRGRHTHYNYDKNDNLTSIDNPDGSKASFEYDSRGRIVKLINENGHSVTYSYGQYGDLSNITNEEGSKITYYHDTLGRTVIIDTNGSKTNFTYNALNRATQVTNALGRSTNISYDKNGNIASIINPLGDASKFEYNALDQLKYLINLDGAAQHYGYDSYGNLTNITDPIGGNIGFEYNNTDYLTSICDQSLKRTYYSYDAAGNLTAFSNSLASKGAEFRYDKMSRLVQKIADNSTFYEYDALDNLSRIKDNSGETVYEYDEMDRLVKKSYPFGAVTYQRRFDKAGNLVYEKQINGDEFAYEYDKAERLSSITKKGAGTLKCKYNEGQDLAVVEYSNGITEYILYNKNKNIVRMKYISATGEVIYQVDYAYNELGQVSGRQSFGEGRAKKDISYIYDKAGRLIQTKSNDRIISEYTYDKNGNRLTSKTPRGKVSYSYDAANRLIKENQTSYSYDNAGNLTFIDAGSGSKTYAYDKENNLISAVLPGGKKNVESYGYDAYNLRINKTFLENTTSSCWFNNELIGELDKNGDVSFINYRYGFKNQQGDYYYITDKQGSVVALADKDGKIVTAYEYDEFGNPILSINVTASENLQQLQTGTTQSKNIVSRIMDFIKNLFRFNKTKDTSAQKQVIFNKIESPIRFAGYYFDKKTSLYYVKSRYYNPETGRFIQPDKISYAAGLNLYAYCGNDPVNYVDPEGFEGFLPAPGTYSPPPISPQAQQAMQQLNNLTRASQGFEQSQYFTKDITNIVQRNVPRSSTGSALSAAGHLAGCGISYDQATFDKWEARITMEKEGRSEDEIQKVEAQIDAAWDRFREKVFNIIPIVQLIKHGKFVMTPEEAYKAYLEAQKELNTEYALIIPDSGRFYFSDDSGDFAGSGSGTGTGTGGVDTGSVAVTLPSGEASPTPTPSASAENILYAKAQFIVWGPHRIIVNKKEMFTYNIDVGFIWKNPNFQVRHYDLVVYDDKGRPCKSDRVGYAQSSFTGNKIDGEYVDYGHPSNNSKSSHYIYDGIQRGTFNPSTLAEFNKWMEYFTNRYSGYTVRIEAIKK